MYNYQFRYHHLLDLWRYRIAWGRFKIFYIQRAWPNEPFYNRWYNILSPFWNED